MKPIFTVLIPTLLIACSNTSNHSELISNANLSAGNSISIKGEGSNVDLAKTKLSAGQDINLCGGKGLKISGTIHAPGNLDIKTGKCNTNKKETSSEKDTNKKGVPAGADSEGGIIIQPFRYKDE